MFWTKVCMTKISKDSGNIFFRVSRKILNLETLDTSGVFFFSENTTVATTIPKKCQPTDHRRNAFEGYGQQRTRPWPRRMWPHFPIVGLHTSSSGFLWLFLIVWRLLWGDNWKICWFGCLFGFDLVGGNTGFGATNNGQMMIDVRGRKFRVRGWKGVDARRFDKCG